MQVAPTAEQPQPEWVSLAPGVSWLLDRPDAGVKTAVAGRVAASMARVYTRSMRPPTHLGDAQHEVTASASLAGEASIIAALLYANRCLRGWRGVRDWRTGEPRPQPDPDATRHALLKGCSPEGDPLLVAFLAWLQEPRQQISDAAIALLVSPEQGSGAAGPVPEIVATCGSILEGYPELWVRDQSGHGLGLDFRNALLIFEEASGEDADFGAASQIFRGIEKLRLSQGTPTYG